MIRGQENSLFGSVYVEYVLTRIPDIAYLSYKDKTSIKTIIKRCYC